MAVSRYSHVDRDAETDSFEALSPFAQPRDPKVFSATMDEDESSFHLTKESVEESWGTTELDEQEDGEEQLDIADEVSRALPTRFSPTDGSGLTADQATLSVAELVELWELASALNERVRRLIVQLLRQPTRSFVPAFPRAPSFARPLREEEFWEVELIDEAEEKRDDTALMAIAPMLALN